jgi:hypothetical protein
MRFVFRGHDENDGLFIGCKQRSDKYPFKKGHVYELRLIMDEWVLRELGPSHIPFDRRDPQIDMSEISWANGVKAVLESNEDMLVLTKDEWNFIMEMRQPGRREWLLMRKAEDDAERKSST